MSVLSLKSTNVVRIWAQPETPLNSEFVVVRGCGGRSCGAVFGHNQLRSYCFQVQPVTCCDLSGFLHWFEVCFRLCLLTPGMKIMLVAGRFLCITSQRSCCFQVQAVTYCDLSGFLIDWSMFHRFFWNERYFSWSPELQLAISQTQLVHLWLAVGSPRLGFREIFGHNWPTS